MLQEVNGTIQEVLPSATLTTSNCVSVGGTYVPSSTIQWNGLTQQSDYASYGYWWHGYPVYVCTDKTKKAIDVLKALEADKLIKCQSVPKFIALVEKIAGLL